MFKHILVPIDLAHLETLGRALMVAIAEARHHDADITYVSVASPLPGVLGHNPEEVQKRLDAFAAEQAGEHGVRAKAHLAISHDPSIDMDATLLGAIRDSGADLVIMATHKPGVAEYFFSSNGGYIASHADVSVMLVRDA